MNYKANIKDIIKDYDFFIFDIFGIIHDGEFLYDGAIELLQTLKSMQKKVVFLSNAPRIGKKAANFLETKFNITSDLHSGVLTPGDVFLQECKSGKYINTPKFFPIGKPADFDITDEVDYMKRVSDVMDADMVICFDVPQDQDLAEFLEKIKSKNIPMICINPDKIVKKRKSADSNEMISLFCAGYAGYEYEKIGGTVVYYGKPYKAVYDFLFKEYKLSKNDKILAIGDSLATDIKGANDYGISSCFVLTGVHNYLIDKGVINETALNNDLKSYNVKPDHILIDLK